MKRWTDHRRLWLYRVSALAITVAVFHVAIVWLLPRLIMWRVMSGPIAQEIGGTNRASFPPPVDATSRRIVMPSPDLLYAVCLLDLSGGPVRVTADPQWPDYWSLALYGANSDNYYVLNDRQAAGKPVDLWVVAAGGNAGAPQVPAGAQVVVSPSRKAFLLMRVLTGDYAAQADAVEKARRSLRCQAAG
jgi:uncharacterized membrane protein